MSYLAESLPPGNALVPKPQVGHIGALDGWRGVAILMVLVAHASFLAHSKLFYKLSYIGPMGVSIFFALSGFLITSLLIRERIKTGRIHLAAFYQRRLFRILPPLLTFLGVLAVVSHFVGLGIPKIQIFSSIFFFRNYLHGNGASDWYTEHLWSLMVEEHFYFIWPAILIWTKGNLKRLISIAAAVAVWRFAVIHLIHGIPGVWTPGRTDIRVDGLLWGCIMAIVYTDPVKLAFVKKWLSGRVLLALVGIDLISNIASGKHDYSFYEPIIFALLVFWPVINEFSALRRFLDSRPLSSLGHISYSLYIWQQMWLLFPKSASPFPTLQRLPASILMTLVCAILSYYLIEQPAINLGKRISAQGIGSLVPGRSVAFPSESRLNQRPTQP